MKRINIITGILLFLVIAATRPAYAQSNARSQTEPKTADLRSAAEKGDSEAQFLLGLRYSKGDGVPFDRVEAYRWLYFAVEGGNSKAIMPRYEVSQGMMQTEIVETQERVLRSLGIDPTTRFHINENEGS